MKLYDAEWAPSPRRVRIYLAEKDIKVDLVKIDLRTDEQVGAPYLAINSRGVVPALELDSGEVISESAAICRYFEALHPEPPLFGATPLDIARIESWIRRIEGEGYAAAVYALRNAHPRFDGRALPGNWSNVPMIPQLVERAGIMWDGFLRALDNQLAHFDWVAGDSYSFADITALITIDFAQRCRLEVPTSCSNIARWHAICSARPSATA
ncbi:MAG: glutathione S-transferase family protein [Sphingomonas sp.]|jgi:glutathione S-transferase